MVPNSSIGYGSVLPSFDRTYLARVGFNLNPFTRTIQIRAGRVRGGQGDELTTGSCVVSRTAFP
jgi:hypothetical protein